MAGLSAQDRLQPSLLDRLVDDDRNASREGLDARVLTKQQLRAAVLRDLRWLFNAIAAEPAPWRAGAAEDNPWARHAHARASVLNYGLPGLGGESVAGLDFPLVEQAVREAIIRFEPRIEAASLEVEVAPDDGGGWGEHNAMRLVIRGRMWSQPVPLELMLSAHVDVETGTVAVRDLR